jgi:hypothetical protein
MLDRDLFKHAREFLGRLRRHDYEVGPNGILFPKASVLVFGEYEHDVNGQDVRRDKNLLPTEGLNHLLNVALDDTAALGAFYLALFSGAYTPVAGITAASFAATATELTSNTEGYSDTTRRLWDPAAASAGAKDNYASKAAFNIETATSVTIRGAALLSSNVKGGTAGVLISIARFAVDRTQFDGDVFNLGYRVRLQSA